MQALRAVLLLVGQILPTVLSVTCYCSECETGACEAEWCLAGFMEGRDNLVRLCGTEQSSTLKHCSVDFLDFKQVCACTTPFCNTYHFLRRSMHDFYRMRTSFKDQPADVPRDMISPDMFDQSDDYRRDYKAGFGDYAYPGDRTYRSRHPYGPHPNKFSNSNLIVLLVCVPLGIGSVAVVLVFVNYHCKLC